MDPFFLTFVGNTFLETHFYGNTLYYGNNTDQAHDIAVLYRRHKDGDLFTKRVRKMGIPCQGGIDSDGRLSSAVRGLFSLMLLSSSKGGPAASSCLSSVLYCLRLHEFIPKDVVVNMKNGKVFPKIFLFLVSTINIFILY